MDSEERVIQRILRAFPRAGSRLRVGIGDDAAVLRPAASTELVVTTDAFLEGVHFLRGVHPPDAAGYKALARATSDIAAMGARARSFFLTIGLPHPLARSAWFSTFLRGMARAARRFGLVLAGGDTTNYSKVVASLTILGECARGRAVLRSGARPGDLLYVSGRLGEAELGLRLILGKSSAPKRWPEIMKKQFYPEPRLALGEWLARRGYASSMIDTSDGLSTDLEHLCKSSGVGAVVWAPQIPKVAIPRALRDLKLDPLTLALHGGEDYELLFTVPRRHSGKMPRRAGGVSLTAIGEITESKRMVVKNEGGQSRPLGAGGWDPFRRA